MTIDSLKTNLQLANYPENEWIRPKNLNIIILESDNNIFFNPKLEKIKFDTTNELILVKYSSLVLCSGILNKFYYNPDNLSISVNSPFGSVYISKSIREPRTGDMVYAYDPVLNTYTGSEIDSISEGIGLTNIFFKDSNLITKIQTAKNGMRFFVLLKGIDIETDTFELSNPAELYTQKDLTNFEADIFISVDRVAGIEFNKNWN